MKKFVHYNLVMVIKQSKILDISDGRMDYFIVTWLHFDHFLFLSNSYHVTVIEIPVK